MGYETKVSKGASSRNYGQTRPASFAKKLFIGSSIGATTIAATTALVVSVFSMTNTGRMVTDSHSNGRLGIALVTKPLKNAKGNRRTFLGKKTPRLQLRPDESVLERFASVEDSAPKTDELTRNFLLANVAILPTPEEEETGISKRMLSTAMIAPATLGALIPDTQKTASIPKAAEQEALLEVAAIEPEENPFDLVLADPDAAIPFPSKRPKQTLFKKKIKKPVRALAYASPKSGMDELVPRKATKPLPARGVAYYVITDQKVYMPDGKVFEAHSGLGHMRDKPKYTKIRGRGPTPPNRYKLTMREKPFHGVPALRMTPTNWSKMHGRNGILAHTYLRKRPGDSAGCIAFKDYYKFLKYYKKGRVKEIVVVARRSDLPKGTTGGRTLASLFKKK